MFGPGRNLFNREQAEDSSDSSDSDMETPTIQKQSSKPLRVQHRDDPRIKPVKKKLTIDSIISKLNLPQEVNLQSNGQRKARLLKNKLKFKKSTAEVYNKEKQRTLKEIIVKPNGPILSISQLQDTIPVKENVSMETHIKCINCIELDKSNSRLVAGSDDHILSFWDLDNMNSSLTPFRTLRPIDGQPIVALSFNSKQDKLLVCGGGCQPKLLTRDGREIVEFVKGDMYIKDLKYTKGHTSNITHGLCNPFDDHLCYTSGVDGTLRVWDMNSKLFGIEQQLPNFMVFKTLDSQKRRLAAQHFCFIKSKKALAVFCDKGNLQIFDQNNRYSRPELTNCFDFQAEITSSLCLQDPFRLACRTVEDGAVRIFDIRRLDKVEKIWHGIYNNHSGTGLEISPDGNLLVTGRSFDRNSEGGLVFLDIYGKLRNQNENQFEAPQKPAIESQSEGLRQIKKKLIHSGLAGQVQQVYEDNIQYQDKEENYRATDISNVEWASKSKTLGDYFANIDSGMCHTTVIKWPKKLNQIFAGCGNSISVFFDRAKSRKGIIPALSRLKTKPKIGKNLYCKSNFLIDRTDRVFKAYLCSSCF
jgi:WD40 repeat protein